MLCILHGFCSHVLQAQLDMRRMTKLLSDLIYISTYHDCSLIL